MTTGTRKIEPADARTAFGAYGSAVAPQHTTAPAPAASAVRINVPVLPGSATSTSTTVRSVDRRLEAVVRQRRDRDDGTGCDRVQHPLEPARADEDRLEPGRAERVSELRGQRVRLGEDLAHADAGRERIRDEHGTFDGERAGAAADRPVPQQPAQLLQPGVARRERLGLRRRSARRSRP